MHRQNADLVARPRPEIALDLGVASDEPAQETLQRRRVLPLIGQGQRQELLDGVLCFGPEALEQGAPPALRTKDLSIELVRRDKIGAGEQSREPLARLARFGLGGPAGSGHQYISWLHVADLNRMFLWAIDSEDPVGTYNATGPAPVTNAEFMATLRTAVGRPWSPPVPAWLVRVGAWAMRTEPELVLTGRRCTPRRAISQGFKFTYPALDAALGDILK